MPLNEAGVLTKQKLINSAKELFYEHGYEKTTLKAICENSEIPRSILFYYFKNKSDIAGLITSDINNQYFGFINEELERAHVQSDLILKSCTATAAFFLSIMSDKKLNRFISELYRSSPGYLPGDVFYKSIFRNMYKARGLNYNSLDFQLMYIYNTSCQGELLHQYLTGQLQATKYEIVAFSLNQLLSDLFIENSEREKTIARAIDLSSKLKVRFIDVFWIPCSVN